jgi:DNA/RNA endonuclease G (NUC1)
LKFKIAHGLKNAHLQVLYPNLLRKNLFPANDYFVQSHGVKTPDAYWKVVVHGTGQNEKAVVWIMPNTTDVTRK